MPPTTAIAAVFQAPTYTMTDGQFHTLLWFTGLIAFWLLLQAAALVAVALMVVKLLKTINEFTTRIEAKTLALTDRFEGKLYPLLDNVQDLMNDTVPKIKRVTESIADTTDVYRAKLAQVDALVTDTTTKAKRQSDRIDSMVTTTLNTAGSVVGRVENAVLAPVRQVSALFSGIRAATTRLVSEYGPSSHGDHTAHGDHTHHTDHAPHTGYSSHSDHSSSHTTTPKPVAFEGDNIYTGLEDDYHA